MSFVWLYLCSCYVCWLELLNCLIPLSDNPIVWMFAFPSIFSPTRNPNIVRIISGEISGLSLFWIISKGKIIWTWRYINGKTSFGPIWREMSPVALRYVLHNQGTMEGLTWGKYIYIYIYSSSAQILAFVTTQLNTSWKWSDKSDAGRLSWCSKCKLWENNGRLPINEFEACNLHRFGISPKFKW